MERMMKGYLGEKWIYDSLSKYPSISKYGIKWQGKSKSLDFTEWKSLNGRHDSKDRPDLMIGDIIAIESKNTSAIIPKEWLDDWYSRFNDVYFTDNKIIVTPDDTKYTRYATRGINFERKVSEIFIITKSRLLKYIRETLEGYNKYLLALKKSFKRVKSITFSDIKSTIIDKVIKQLLPNLLHILVQHTSNIVHMWYNAFIQHGSLSYYSDKV